MPNNNVLTPTFTPFASGCGMCKPSSDYNTVVTGGANYSNDGLIPKSNGQNFYNAKNFTKEMNNSFIKDNYGIDYATSFGGKSKKPKPVSKKPETVSKKPVAVSKKPVAVSKKTMAVSKKQDTKQKVKKGGSNKFDNMISEETRSEVIHQIMNKIDHKNMEGGMESSGATSLPQKFFNPDTSVNSYNELAGNGVMTAYGINQSGNIGSGMLAPYHLSEQNTGIKTGGKKKLIKKRSMKGGEYASINQEETLENTYVPYETNHAMKGGKKSMKGGEYASINQEETLENVNVPYALKGGKKLIKKRSMKGGMESSGATALPPTFYNPKVSVDNYNELAGNGVMTAYGTNQSGNVGTGMLAPYHLSEANTGIKTGGKKLIKKRSMKGGDGPIPYISDSAVNSVNKSINSAISGFSDFMIKLDEDYLKSVDYVKSIKIGNQRLIQGGKKNVKKGGGTGSDFASTLNSRGPVNAPDDYWGVPGEQWFRQFTKTGDYIPNSQLPYNATPLSAGIGNSPTVSGYDSLGTDYGSV